MSPRVAPVLASVFALTTLGLALWPRTLFDLDQLAARHGAERVLSYALPAGSASARLSSIKRDFYMWSDAQGERAHLRERTFGEFLAALASGQSEYCMVNATKNLRLRDLLAAQAGTLACMPADGARPSPEGREFFFGSADAGPGLHHDGPIESFLCQLVGEKQINTFSPADIGFLYPAAAAPAPHSHFSAVADSFHPDLERFPLFARATPHQCLLEPGDVLYMPPRWYHDTAPRGPTAMLTLRVTPPA